MEEIKKETTTGQTKKFSYEELENIANNLSLQVQQLSTRLQESNMFNVFKRLDYCFKAVEIASVNPLFTPSFAEKCAKEIEELMSPVETEETETSKKE